MMYTSTPDYYNDYIEHYGVMGMKWGVRKNPERAYEKATAKLNKLKKISGIKYQGKISKASKKVAKTNKKYAKASKRYVRALNNPFSSKDKLSKLMIKRDKAQNKATQAQNKLSKVIGTGASATRKQVKWEQQMNKVFKGLNVGQKAKNNQNTQSKSKVSNADRKIINNAVQKARKTGSYNMEFLERNLDQDQRTGKLLQGKALDNAYRKYLTESGAYKKKK